MVRHVVLFRFRREVAPSVAEVEQETMRQLRALPAVIPEILKLRVGRDFVRGPTSFDMGLYVVFADRAGLSTYRDHPEHQKVVAYLAQVVSERVVADWED